MYVRACLLSFQIGRNYFGCLGMLNIVIFVGVLGMWILEIIDPYGISYITGLKKSDKKLIVSVVIYGYGIFYLR